MSTWKKGTAAESKLCAPQNTQYMFREKVFQKIYSLKISYHKETLI